MTPLQLRLKARPRPTFAVRIAALVAVASLLGPWPSAAPADTPGTAAPPRDAEAAPPSGSESAATGKVSIRLVRLLSEVPDEVAKRSGPLHDLRVALVPGNVLVFRKGTQFAALLPIDRIEGGRVDSLRYFYFVEKSPMFWFFGGERARGIRTVPDGGAFQFDTFKLLWRHGAEAGWIYFPDIPENQGLRFSVVSGQSVDEADPKETKYWVELGAEGKAGF